MNYEQHLTNRADHHRRLAVHVADHARTVGHAEYRSSAARSGYISLNTPSPRDGGHADVVIDYDKAADHYTLRVGDETVTGVGHTLERVLATRLFRLAERVPAELVAQYVRDGNH